MPNRRDPSEKLQDFTRAMRSEQSEPERILWRHLRDRQLGEYKFRRQVPVAGRIVDFACLEKLLIVEADGSQHFDDGNEERDAHRDADLARLGWETLRFESTDILSKTQDVLRTILLELNERPSPQPSPASGRGGRSGQTR